MVILISPCFSFFLHLFAALIVALRNNDFANGMENVSDIFPGMLLYRLWKNPLLSSIIGDIFFIAYYFFISIVLRQYQY